MAEIFPESFELDSDDEEEDPGELQFLLFNM